VDSAEPFGSGLLFLLNMLSLSTTTK